MSSNVELMNRIFRYQYLDVPCCRARLSTSLSYYDLILPTVDFPRPNLTSSQRHYSGICSPRTSNVNSEMPFQHCSGYNFEPASGSENSNFFSCDDHYLDLHSRPGELYRSENSVNARVNTNGFVRIELNSETYIDITVDKAIRIVNEWSGTRIAISGDSSRWAFKHECGEVVEIYDGVKTSRGPLEVIVLCEPSGTNKFAKISDDGILFGQEGSLISYKMDESGTKAKMFKSFRHWGQGDCTVQIIMKYSDLGSRFQQEANLLESKIGKYRSNYRTQIWIIDNIRISMDESGIIDVYKDQDTHLFIGSNGEAGLYVGNEKCEASCDEVEKYFLFVQRGHKCVYYDGNRFAVHHKNQVSGFEEPDNRIKLFRCSED